MLHFQTNRGLKPPCNTVTCDKHRTVARGGILSTVAISQSTTKKPPMKRTISSSSGIIYSRLKKKEKRNLGVTYSPSTFDRYVQNNGANLYRVNILDIGKLNSLANALEKQI